MSVVEPASAALDEAATQLQKRQHAKGRRRSDEISCKLLLECFSPRRIAGTGMPMPPLKLFRLTHHLEERSILATVAVQ